MRASGREPSDAVDEGTARALRAAGLLTGSGPALLCAVAGVAYARAGTRAPAPEVLRLVNALTVGSMALALGTILASEAVWRRLLAGATPDGAARAVRRAFLLRTALREAGALAGGVTAVLAAGAGVLRAYPAYWANLVPSGLFLSYLWAHWPTLEKLRAELSDLTAA